MEGVFDQTRDFTLGVGWFPSPKIPPFLRFLVALLLGLLVCDSAAAQQASLAEQLFQEAKRLVAEGQLDAACLKFEESQNLDPATGTLLNLAVCHKEQGRSASAWAEFRQAIVLSRRDNRPDRVEFAQKQLQELEPQLLRIRLVPPASTVDEPLNITLDGADVGPAALGVAFPVDPGKHHLLVESPGCVPWETTVEVDSEEPLFEVVIPTLDKETAPLPKPQPLEQPAEQEPLPSAPSDPSPPPRQSLSPFRKVSLGALGVGVLGVGLGAAFGIAALDLASTDGCSTRGPGVTCDNPEDARDVRSAQAWASASTVSFVVGGVFVSAAVVLWVLDPDSRRMGATPKGLAWGPGWRLMGSRGLLEGEF